MTSKQHWDQVYSTRSAEAVSWFQPHAEYSLRLIRAGGMGPQARVIDVGGGASTLVDDLLANGFAAPTVLDLSATALAAARLRLGAAAAGVTWIEADVTTALGTLPHHGFDVWHDRAVFHFLTGAAERAAYVRTVLHAVKPGGLVIVATFAEDGPQQCSGLPVMRYRPNDLHAEFGTPFELIGHEPETHHTPGGTAQQFVWCYCRKHGN